MSRRRIATARHALRLVVWPLQGLALATFWWCCAMMSPERAAAFGARLGRVLGPRFRWHRRLKNNLAIALPTAGDKEVAAIAREVWGSFGATVAEYAHLKPSPIAGLPSTSRSSSIREWRSHAGAAGRSSS